MKDINELYNNLKEFKYGWHDKEKNIHESLKNFREQFLLQDNETILNDKCAVCWEMCEVQREFFNERNIENKTIFAYLNKSRNNACHTFSVFFLNDRCYWFEASWANQKGIHEFNNLDEILDFYKNNFHDFAREEYDKSNMMFFEYDKAPNGIGAEEFYNHCFKSKLINQIRK